MWAWVAMAFLACTSPCVVTINMPRIAYQAESEADFYQRLGHLMDVSARSLKTKRTVITKLLDAGLYPYTKRYLGTFENHFSTIGLVGMNEACLNAQWLRAETGQRSVALVGHMPFLGRLASLLVVGDEQAQVVGFHMGGLVKLEPKVDRDGFCVAWALPPDLA